MSDAICSLFSRFLDARVTRITPDDFCASLPTIANLFLSRDRQIFREPQRADETDAALIHVSVICLRDCRIRVLDILQWQNLAHPKARLQTKETECIYNERNPCVQNDALIIINAVWINSVYLRRHRIPPFYCPCYFEYPGIVLLFMHITRSHLLIIPA